MSDFSAFDAHRLHAEAVKRYVGNTFGKHEEDIENLKQANEAVQDSLETVEKHGEDIESLKSEGVNLRNDLDGKSNRSDTYTKTEVDAKLEQSGKVKSVNGRIGDVVITSDDISYNPPAGVVEESVKEWLDDHPEATTTVQDGSITTEKFEPATLQSIVGLNAKAFGAVGDGETNDSPALQNLIDMVYERGGGQIYLPKGVYVLNRQLFWKPNVSLVGEGVGMTILKTVYEGPTNSFGLSAISYDRTEFGNSKETAFTNCLFRDFEIDGSQVISTNNMYSVGIKGIVLQYLINCTFENLYIHDTIATGLGVDYLDQTVIHNVRCKNCGRGFGVMVGGSLGGAGIGIGSGYLESENCVVTDCICEGNGSNGIFFEHQKLFDAEGEQYDAKGIIIANCICKNNRNNGIGLRGGDTVIISNCEAYGNKYGININTLECENVKISGCIALDNQNSDISLSVSTKNTSVENCVLGSMQLYDGQYATSKQESVMIRGCKFRANNVPQLKFARFMNLAIMDNVFEETASSHVFMSVANSYSSEESTGLRILGNVFEESTNSNDVEVAYKVKDVVVANNIFHKHNTTPSKSHIVVGVFGTADEIHLDNNRCNGRPIIADIRSGTNVTVDGASK